MTTEASSTRRDPRHRIPSGKATLEFSDPRAEGVRLRAVLTTISAAGVAFEIDLPLDALERGTLIEDASIRIGACVLPGSFLICNASAANGPNSRFGCLFFPASLQIEDRFMALLSGIELFAETDDAVV